MTLTLLCTLHVAIGGTIATGIFLSAGSVCLPRLTKSAPVDNTCYIGHRAGGSRQRIAGLLRGGLLCVYCRDHIVRITFSRDALYPGLMVGRGEMSSMFPVSGAFSVYGTRFVSPALGFTLGMITVSVFRTTSDLFNLQGGIIGFNGTP